MMQKIWAVSHGSYSDYGVVAVFSTKELAEAFAAKKNVPNEDGYMPFDAYEVESFPFDPTTEDMRFTHVMMKRDGTSTVQMDSDDSLHRTYLRKPEKRYGGWSLEYYLQGAHDAERAVKRANEIRAQLIAEGKWPAEESDAPGANRENINIEES